MDSPAIALNAVSKSFDGRRSFAVRDVSLALARGGLLALIGASGSGKTTLLKTLNRLIEPDAGEVLIEGRSAADRPAAQLRRRIGYVIQGVGLFPHLTVAQNIAVGPQLAGWDRDRITARTAELLDLVDLPQAFAARLPHALSGGQRQRVGLARALAAGPKIMLMDEPFGALDPATRDALGTAYRALHDRLGLTTVMVTHDVQEAILLADRIGVMDAGRLIAEGPPEALAASAEPAVQALMSVPRRQAQRVAERLGGAHG